MQQANGMVNPDDEVVSQGQGILYVLMASFAAFVLACSLASLTLCVIKGLGWPELNNAAGFWNGHFSTMAIVLLALGLYFQSRDQETRERERVIELKEEDLRRSVEQRQWALKLLLLQGTNVSDRIVAWQIDNSSDEPIQLNGALQVSRAISELGQGKADSDIYIDPSSLQQYVLVATQVKQISHSISEDAPEIGIDASTVSMFEVPILKYAQSLDEQRATTMRELEALNPPDRVEQGVASMLKAGWSVNWSCHQGKWYAVAERVGSIGRQDLASDGNGTANAIDGIESLVDEFRSRYDNP